jgi:hypothetical protein
MLVPIRTESSLHFSFKVGNGTPGVRFERAARGSSLIRQIGYTESGAGPCVPAPCSSALGCLPDLPLLQAR